MNNKRLGKQSVSFDIAPRILSSGTVVGDLEGQGPIGKHFDLILEDDMWGEKSFEKSECKMYERAVRIASQKANIDPADLDCLLGGDLLNQIITANYAARQLGSPFLGLYGACSTMAESMLIGAMLINGGFAQYVACAASSHFSTAERQYRMPLELGSQPTPTSQRTVTGSGCLVLTDGGNQIGRGEDNEMYNDLFIAGGTIGKVIDMGITDANNMGAAMAPAALDTMIAHFNDTNRTLADYDLIITGDLGLFGTEMLYDLCRDSGIDLGDKHIDCGTTIFEPSQDVDCGASGCGCAATVLSAYLLKRMDAGDFNRAFFMATGALMSPMSGLQGESIPCIAHGIVLERRTV